MSRPTTDRFVILLDGELQPTDRVRRQVAGCRVLAADGGIRHAATLSLEPELWLGDFDSAKDDLHSRFSGTPKQAYPADKALSDGEIAIRHAIQNGARELILVGGLGGVRTDHVFINLAIAATMAQTCNVLVSVTSGREEALPLKENRVLKPDWPEGTVFSIMNFSAIAGLSITGAKWPLEHVSVPFGSTLSLSNVAGSELEILLTEGCGIAIGQVEC